MEHEGRREDPAAETEQVRPAGGASFDRAAGPEAAGGPAPDRDTSRPDGPEELEGLSVEELRVRAREASDEARRNWQQFLHSAADLENYKKQAARDRQDAVERTRRQMLSLVLGVLDNLERAMAFGGEPDGSAKPLLEGLRMAHREILDQLKAIGVRPIEAAGSPFDPRLHEAVAVVPPEQAHQAAGMVAGEVLKGYLLNEDVLRPAKVAVVGEPDREGRESGR